MYAYCENNPINFSDPSGFLKTTITFRYKRTIVRDFINIALIIFGLYALFATAIATSAVATITKVIITIIPALQKFLPQVKKSVVAIISTIVYLIDHYAPSISSPGDVIALALDGLDGSRDGWITNVYTLDYSEFEREPNTWPYY